MRYVFLRGSCFCFSVAYISFLFFYRLPKSAELQTYWWFLQCIWNRRRKHLVRTYSSFTQLYGVPHLRHCLPTRENFSYTGENVVHEMWFILLSFSLAFPKIFKLPLNCNKTSFFVCFYLSSGWLLLWWNVLYELRNSFTSIPETLRSLRHGWKINNGKMAVLKCQGDSFTLAWRYTCIAWNCLSELRKLLLIE